MQQQSPGPTLNTTHTSAGPVTQTPGEHIPTPRTTLGRRERGNSNVSFGVRSTITLPDSQQPPDQTVANIETTEYITPLTQEEDTEPDHENGSTADSPARNTDHGGVTHRIERAERNRM